ncbi:MAG: hypothetical protein FRX48_02586 [Lasallia pustulata]|uniref:C2H2-type domain-containing protein n=1 Tax=Lasallia pustulata TaxID=136370 RepID=A0A5M8PWZ9_9LECA|nr:MAG: hypothetical protein FRX48_02586 [Lasallia pustulata]
MGLTASPYNSHPTENSAYTGSPQPPPSPPVEDPNSKCTLPSIQSLIGMADGSPSTSRDQQTEPERQSVQSQPPQQGDNSQQAPDYSSQPYGQPTSPSAASSHSSTSAPYYGGAINNVEPHQQRQSLQTSSLTHHPGPPQTSQSPYATSAYVSSPSAMSNYSYPSPNHPNLPSSALLYQRPLPSSFPPPSVPGGMNSSVQGSHQSESPVDHANPWQHHHYISPSSSAAFAGQSQDRYICQTCNKAFSRPSSLRIHSHSHTGEKPFKCPHGGCGKAFSVRSNMKRHERGCHGGGSPGSV